MQHDPEKISIAEAFALYHDPDRGPLSQVSRGWRTSNERARRRFESHFGPERVWNSIRKADLRAYVARRSREGCGIRGIETELKIFSVVSNWLVADEEIEVRNPAAGFLKSRTWRELKAGYEPARERYRGEEVEAIRTAAWNVDPRLGLLVALADETGQRIGALLQLTRSCVDAELNPSPGDRAPHGWILFPAKSTKNRKRQVCFLTSGARADLERALGGYLEVLDSLWKLKGRDYPLFPSGPVRDGVALGTRCMEKSNTRKLLCRAEQKAQLEHVERRGWHAFRRRFTDVLAENGATADHLQVALGHSTPGLAAEVYREQGSFAALAQVRELREASAAAG